MPKFRKKPVEIEAIQWTGLPDFAEILDGSIRKIESARMENFDDWIVANQGNRKCRYVGNTVVIPTLEGEMTASPGDWIIKGVDGELYPCKPGIFARTYDRVGE